MPDFALKYSYKVGEFADAMGSIKNPMAVAATAAMTDVGNLAKAGGRAVIGTAGFSARSGLRRVEQPQQRRSS